MSWVRTLISRTVAATPLSYWPVRVRSGPAAGAKWTLAPHSANWRMGGAEGDVQAGLALLPDIKGKVCWDFGAHFGIHTVGMAMAVGPEGQVVAFEPDPVAFKRLDYHVRINGLRNIILLQKAASSEAGTRQLINSHGLGSACCHFQYEDESITDRTRLLVVETAVADELVGEKLIRPPNLIKVDVQGHGGKALQGAKRSIAEALPLIVFSNHSQWELADTRALLEPLGYVAFDLGGRPIEWSTLGTGILRVSATHHWADESLN